MGADNTPTRWQTLGLRIVSLKALVLLLGLSASAICATWNVRHGWSTGVLLSTTDAYLYAIMSGVADGFKAVGLVLIALVAKEFGRGAATAVFCAWLGTVAYSLTSALGYVATSRGDATAMRQDWIDKHKGAKATRDRLQGELDELLKSKPKKAAHDLKTDVAEFVKKLNDRGVKQENCHKVALWKSESNADLKAACASVNSLNAQLSYFPEQARLSQALGEAEKTLAKTIGTTGEADPVAGNIAALLEGTWFEASTETIGKWLARFAVVVFELLGSVSFLAVKAMDWPEPKRQRPLNRNVTGQEVKSRREGHAQRMTLADPSQPTRESVVILAALRAFDPAVPPAGFRAMPNSWVDLTQGALAELAAVPKTCVHRELHSLVDRGLIAMQTTKRGTRVRVLEAPRLN